ncbi:glycosyltransferase BC10 [Ziziphus jujuba]|uniref:Glycosyltransferase BC10 n=1 Tax=Ziziphus jujuba TaxID=326968 RepID=A0A6P4AJA5_ZIZJJ|nr:glycosyltransferase BC10 [Ziziphus jujuba]
MLSPTPFSLICALLLCLPLAIVFTITSPASSTTATTTTTTTVITISGDVTQNPETLLSTTLFSTGIHHRKMKNRSSISSTSRNTTTSISPPPPARPPEDDESLFRLASRVNSRPLPRRGPKKLAFMFLTNTPLPFAPLWEVYFNDTPKTLYTVYVHADPNFPYDPPFSGVFAHRVIHSKPTERYSPSLTSAARRLLAHALLDDPSNAMFALLSPSCIPLHSFNFTYRTLSESKKSFIEILENEIGNYDRWAARGPDAMLPDVRLEDFRIGSQFWVLTRKHARFVVSDRRFWSKFSLPCVRIDTCYPEENYFPTLLSMRDPRGCIPATLTHVNWTGSFDGHPRMYEAFEVGPDLIELMRNERPRYGDDGTNGSDLSIFERHDPFLFARKFTPDAIQPLMSIANDVLFKD